MTHCSTARSVFRTRPRVGRATLTTVLSRMTMNVPRMIAMSGTSTDRVLAPEETAIDIYRHDRRPFYCREQDEIGRSGASRTCGAVRSRWKHRALTAVSQAGMVNNLNDSEHKALTASATAATGVAGNWPEAASGELVFASLMADNAAVFGRDLAGYLARRLGITARSLDALPWQEREQMLYRGQAHLGIVCGLQYVLAVDHGERPGVDLLAAPVMRGERYLGRPIYFSDVIVRRGSRARCLADLRGATWAYNEPTSQSGYNLPPYVLAIRGGRAGFSGRVVASAA